MAQQYGFPAQYGLFLSFVKSTERNSLQRISGHLPILDADIIIDIGKLKTHCMTGMSGAVKNMFGVVPGLMKTGTALPIS